MSDIEDMYPMTRKGMDGWNNSDFEKYKLKAEKGEVEAMYELARCFNFGCGTEQDITYATTWLNKAIANGHQEALEVLNNYNLTPREREKYILFSVDFFTDSPEKFRNRGVVMTGGMLNKMGFNHFENDDDIYYELRQISDGMHVIGYESSHYSADEDGFGEEWVFDYGYYDKNFCPVIPFKYEKATAFHNGRAKVKDSTEIYYINKKGEKIDEVMI